jgi:hypothetical protein
MLPFLNPANDSSYPKRLNPSMQSLLLKPNFVKLRFFAVLSLMSLSSLSHGSENPFLGRWALTIPGGGAGWLGVEDSNGTLRSRVLWGGGSVVPTASTKLEGNTLIVTRESKNKEGKVSTETITAKVEGDSLSLTVLKRNPAGKDIGQPATFAGKRIPELPTRPNLSQVKFGEPIQLLNGKDLTGWRLLKQADNGWSVVDGVLQNRVVKAKRQALRQSAH